MDSENGKFDRNLNRRISSTHTSHLTEYSADYLAIDKGPYGQSVRTLLLCNSQTISYVNNDKCTVDENINSMNHSLKTQQTSENNSEYSNDNKSSADKIENETIFNTEEESNKTNDVTYASTVTLAKPYRFQKVSFGREPANHSVFTEKSSTKSYTTRIVTPVSTSVHVAEKTTCVRPGFSRSQLYMQTVTERYNKLTELVKKIVEARKREKQNEAWNNYINELKNKHKYHEVRSMTSHVIDKYECRFASSSQLNRVYDIRNYAHSSRQSIPTSYDPFSCQCSGCRRNFLTDFDIITFPTSCQGRMTMFKRGNRTNAAHSPGRDSRYFGSGSHNSHNYRRNSHNFGNDAHNFGRESPILVPKVTKGRRAPGTSNAIRDSKNGTQMDEQSTVINMKSKKNKYKSKIQTASMLASNITQEATSTNDKNIGTTSKINTIQQVGSSKLQSDKTTQDDSRFILKEMATHESKSVGVNKTTEHRTEAATLKAVSSNDYAKEYKEAQTMLEEMKSGKYQQSEIQRRQSQQEQPQRDQQANESQRSLSQKNEAQYAPSQQSRSQMGSYQTGQQEHNKAQYDPSQQSRSQMRASQTSQQEQNKAQYAPSQQSRSQMGSSQTGQQEQNKGQYAPSQQSRSQMGSSQTGQQEQNKAQYAPSQQSRSQMESSQTGQQEQNKAQYAPSQQSRSQMESSQTGQQEQNAAQWVRSQQSGMTLLRQSGQSQTSQPLYAQHQQSQPQQGQSQISQSERRQSQTSQPQQNQRGQSQQSQLQRGQSQQSQQERRQSQQSQSQPTGFTDNNLNNNSKLNYPPSIENKLQFLINSINMLLDEMQVKEVPQSEPLKTTCNQFTCVGKRNIAAARDDIRPKMKKIPEAVKEANSDVSRDNIGLEMNNISQPDTVVKHEESCYSECVNQRKKFCIDTSTSSPKAPSTIFKEASVGNTENVDTNTYIPSIEPILEIKEVTTVPIENLEDESKDEEIKVDETEELDTIIPNKELDRESNIEEDRNVTEIITEKIPSENYKSMDGESSKANDDVVEYSQNEEIHKMLAGSDHNLHLSKSTVEAMKGKPKIICKCGQTETDDPNENKIFYVNDSYYNKVDKACSKINKILTDEMNKSFKAKKEIDEMISKELYNPCGVQINIDIPCRDISTEVTSSLSKTALQKISRKRGLEEVGGNCEDTCRHMAMTAVNTEPLSLFGILRVTSDALRALLPFVPFMSHLPIPQLFPAASRAHHGGQYLCNICGATFDRPTQLSQHVERHSKECARDCCVCRHFLRMRQDEVGHFKCKYCGQCFMRAYCCELHMHTCARRMGLRHDVQESLATLT